MIYRILSNVLLIAGVGFLALAGYEYFSLPATAPEPQLEAEQDIELVGIEAGKAIPVMLRLDNRSGQSMRVLGVSTC